MSFLPISILAYALNGGSIIIDKILLKHSLPNPFVYTFYISILGLLALFLFPFGLVFNPLALGFGIVSGVTVTLALLFFFKSLSEGEASIVAPIVGGLNPLYTFIIGSIFLNQELTRNQLLAFLVLIIGAGILTFNVWSTKLKINRQLLMMNLAGLFFALSYLFLKETFSNSNFISGLIFSRVAAGVFVLSFLVIPVIRSKIFARKEKAISKGKTALLLLIGQGMGAAQGLLLALGVSLANPALVNSLFGVQYLVILSTALLLRKNHPNLLDENLTRSTLLQKIIGAAIISLGIYLLS